MKKIALYYLTLAVVCLSFQVQPAFCAERTPKQLVHDFYTWYFAADSGLELAIKNDAIYQYVSKETVAYVRRPYSGRVDYFTKLGTDIDWKKMAMVLGKQIAMADDTYIIPLTFKKQPGAAKEDIDNIVVIVYVKKENGSFYIYRVSDIYPYS